MTQQVESTPTTPPVPLLERIHGLLKRLNGACAEKLEAWRSTRTAEGFAALEQEIHATFRAAADEVTAEVLDDIVTDEALQQESNEAVRASGKPYRSGGRRAVKVTLLGGSTTEVKVPYLRPDISKRPGRKRGHGRRGKGGVGLYPALAALGIWFGVTPAVAKEVCKQVTASDSVRAGRAALAGRNLDLGHKQTLRLIDHVSHRMLEQRQTWLTRTQAAPPATGPLAGKRVVVAIDGGRLRERHSSGRGRKRAETGHRGYETPWREPKMFVIYVVDAEGERDPSIRPVYDGTLGDCNVMFDLLAGYLQDMGAAGAQSLTVIGDGARWIWERVAPLVTRLGIDSDKVSEVIDWSHAVSTLHTIVDYAKNWTGPQRHAWVGTAKDLLHAGKIDDVLAQIDALAIGRRAKQVRTHRDYFKTNAERMQYATFVANGIPTGSGAVESAVRCIINLRLKGCGKFWKEQNAEGMILLRSYLKAERFDDLFAWSLAQAAPWWHHETPYANSPIVARTAPPEPVT
jgi:hypothetical protein